MTIMLRPQDFFQLTHFEHSPVFQGAEYTWEALARLERYLEEHLEPAILGEVMPGAWIEGRVYLGPGTVVEPGALVRGPAIIGPGCQLRHGCYIRGRVLVGENCVIGHCTEVKSSILLDGVKAAHFNYIGDSILGNGVRLGAGTVCSNVKLAGGNVVVEVNGRRIDTGLRKLGAIVGDGAETGCNAVLNPAALVGPGARVYPGVSVRGFHPAGALLKLRQNVERTQVS